MRSPPPVSVSITGPHDRVVAMMNAGAIMPAGPVMLMAMVTAGTMVAARPMSAMARPRKRLRREHDGRDQRRDRADFAEIQVCLTVLERRHETGSAARLTWLWFGCNGKDNLNSEPTRCSKWPAGSAHLKPGKARRRERVSHVSPAGRAHFEHLCYCEALSRDIAFAVSHRHGRLVRPHPSP